MVQFPAGQDFSSP